MKRSYGSTKPNNNILLNKLSNDVGMDNCITSQRSWLKELYVQLNRFLTARKNILCFLLYWGILEDEGMGRQE